MKRMILLSLFCLAGVVMANAQRFALIDMEYIMENIPEYQQANNGVYSDYFCMYVADTTLTTAAAYKEAVKNIEICVVLPESAKITYHFDNVGQLITFLGTNNIWTDTNGINTATYLKHQS